MDKKYIFGLLLVLVVIAVPILIYKSQGLKKAYKLEVLSGLSEMGTLDNSILTENDIKQLPHPVQKYIRYTGAIGKEKVKSFRSVGEGEFKINPKKNWVKAKSEQYNFISNPQRFYFMQLNMFGLPVVGLHIYKDALATMKVKVAGLITVADAKGSKMNKAETVTVFNDMCLLAPATLIDQRIQWEQIDPLQVKVIFNNNGVKISAELYFNEKGELINFISNDRYMTSSGESYQQAQWSTPVKDYQDFGGIRLASYGEAHWSLPEGDYCYGKIAIKEIKYNFTSYK